MKTLQIALCSLLLISASSFAGAADELSALLSREERAAEDRARDAGRKPAEVIAFLGIGPGMTVVDLIAGAGYYSEVLSLAVGPEGKVYAHNTETSLRVRDGANRRALEARLADGRLGNVERLDRELADLGLEADSLDAALTALNFHDVYNAAGEAAAIGFLRRVYELLKPGGVLGLIDHAGNGSDADAALHRIDESKARAAAEKVGFEIETSDLLRNPDDDRSNTVFDPAIRGKTDRFLFRLRKPKS